MKRKRQTLAAVFIMLAAITISYAAVKIICSQVARLEALVEYAELQALGQPYAVPPETGEASATTPPEKTADIASEIIHVPEPMRAKPETRPDEQRLTAINPDYIGWIRIEDTAIDYPIARGEDNAEYLNKTFAGSPNASGAVFMDFRCAEGFDSTPVIVYGHNMKDGSMFAALEEYLNDDFLNEHSIVTVFDSFGEVSQYEVCEAKLTDINDELFDIPCEIESGQDMLILSTCTNTEEERLLVIAKKE